MHTSVKSQSGFTLVEILIAAAIMMVLALLISSMLFNAQTSQKRLEDRAGNAETVQGAALDLRLRPIPTST